MADNYLGKKMEDYMARSASSSPFRRPAPSLDTLLARNRSHRGYDAGFKVRADQLRRIIGVNTKIPSAMNRQLLRFRPVLSDEAPEVLKHLRMGAALPELHLPLAGTEPNAFIVICSAAGEDRYVDIDLGISVQSMLLKAVEMGLNGLCIGSFNREAVRRTLGLEHKPLFILAIGRGAERIETVDIGADESRAYYRRDGVHYVPKLRLDDLIL